MSFRITRSATRPVADSDNTDNEPTEIDPTHDIKTPAKSKKRKTASRAAPSSPRPDDQDPLSTSSRRSKRQKVNTTLYTPATTASGQSRRSPKNVEDSDTIMSNNGYDDDDASLSKSAELTKSSSSSKTIDESNKHSSAKSSSRRHSSRGNKKSPTELSPPEQAVTSKRFRKKLPRKNTDGEAKDADKSKSSKSEVMTPPPPPAHPESNSDVSPDTGLGDDMDPFASALFGRAGSSGLSSTLRALSGMMSGMASRFRDILTNLRQFDNPTMQMVALEELSNLLLVSNEDNLAGQFAPDPFIKELVLLMQPNPITGEESPEIMLLACRCLANLMEAMRGSSANVVYGGAVPVLCQKLLDIQFIDVAEQALSTLAKISTDFPAAIVRDGGLTACLQYLDFFATGTQRVAVTTAANCCRNIPHESFTVIRDVMPILQSVLASHDQKVVEQGCLCVTRIIDSFKHSATKIEQLVDTALLKAVLGLLAPGTTNLIGASIHTDFLRVLAIVAMNSPGLSTELLKLNIVDTLYQILTGVSPPVEDGDVAPHIDSVVIMQALIHRPREQIYEALNVICELLPAVKTNDKVKDEVKELLGRSPSDSEKSDREQLSRHDKRIKLLRKCKAQTRRFAMVLLPTLTDAYSSTVNLSVRQRVLVAQLKILSNLDSQVVEDALRPVPYASFLASILSQEDHPSLVFMALQASELLFDRLESIYKHQFYREGVVGEIKKLASRTLENVPRRSSKAGVESATHCNLTAQIGGTAEAEGRDQEEVEPEDNDVADDDGDEGREDGDEIVIAGDIDILDDDRSATSEDEDVPPSVSLTSSFERVVVTKAKDFLDKYDTGSANEFRIKAERICEELRLLADAIRAHYSNHDEKTSPRKNLFAQLVPYFDGDALESITSSELLDSGVIKLLGDTLDPKLDLSRMARSDFVEAFMVARPGKVVTSSTGSSQATPFTVLVSKLQDLLSRSEHFEVLTVNSNPLERNRSSSTSMLSRQIRLHLKADEDSGIPAHYRDLIVSIHAIATLQALDDYLRPRISLSERANSSRRRDMLQQLANARMAQLSGAAESGLFSPLGTDLHPRPSNPFSSSHPLSSRSKTTEQAPEHEEKQKPDKSKRRTSRRLQKQDPINATSPQPEPSAEQGSNLEIVDEQKVEDEVEEALDAMDQIDAIMGELEEPSEDEREPDAVNVEIASTGKATARKDDGSRVYTPSQPSTPVAPSKTDKPSLSAPSSQSTTKRSSSYAAVAAAPQDWHIEFSIDDKPVPDNITVYRAVHHNRGITVDAAGRNVWASTHLIKFKRVDGPPPAVKLSTSEQDTQDRVKDGLPASLDGHPITSSILTLMRILHDLNADLDEIVPDQKLNQEPPASFINTKLTAKMNRQLEEPLIVASNCLPDWSEDLTRSFPFLFPFETRHLFLQSTSFGYSRSITRWQHETGGNDRRDHRRDDRPLMGRPMRQKVRIARQKMLESAMKVMDHFGASPSILEVEYFDEVGTGLGPTLEFYSIVSKEFSKKSMKLWRENDATDDSTYVFSKNGLFPAPMSPEEQDTDKGKKILQAFRMLGLFVARSMLDSRIIDINFNPTFFKLADEMAAPSLGLLGTIDQDLANSMAKLQAYVKKRARIVAENSTSKETQLRSLTINGATVEDLGLDFTVPGYPEIALIENGSNTEVTETNIERYVDKVIEVTLDTGISAQISAFKAGFSQVFPYSSLKAFTPAELVMLFGRVEEDWSIETLMDSIKADHGFNMDSKTIKNLLQVMASLTPAQRRDFLQFVSGSPRLPIGGFKALTPMFTVVCKPSEPPYVSDDYLPSVMTCANYLKLPDYTDIETMRRKLFVAMSEGQSAFHLS